jgi:hypothetical protein
MRPISLMALRKNLYRNSKRGVILWRMDTNVIRVLTAAPSLRDLAMTNLLRDKPAPPVVESRKDRQKLLAGMCQTSTEFTRIEAFGQTFPSKSAFKRWLEEQPTAVQQQWRRMLRQDRERQAGC